MLQIEKINARFRRVGEIILRFRWINLIAFLLLVITATAGMRLLQKDVSTESWFLEGDQLLETKKHFETIFGSEDFCAVLVEADNVFTPEILAGIRAMGRELAQKVPYADDVLSLTDFDYTSGNEEGLEIRPLVPERIPTDPAELQRIRDRAMAKPALKNRLVSDDGRQTWLMLRMKRLPEEWKKVRSENPESIIGRTVNEIIGQEKYAFLNPKATGLPVINSDKMAFFAKETPRLLGISLLVAVVVLGVALRSLRGVVFPMVAAGSGLVLVFGAQGYLGIRIDPSMIFLPFFLSIALATGYSIHIFNYFTREFLRSGRRRDALLLAIEETGWPLLFCSLTTIAALLSFWFVPLRPIRWVGLSAASLVGVTYVLVIILLPSLLSFGKDRPSRPVGEKNGRRAVDRLMIYLGVRVLCRPKTTLVVYCLVTIVCLIGATKVDVSFDSRQTFGLGVPYVNRINYIGETKVGSVYSYGVAIEFDRAGAAKEPDNLRKFDQLTREIETFPLTKKMSSLLDVVKDLNQVLNDGSPAMYRIPESREQVAQSLLLYENAGGSEAEKWVDYDYQRLRLMVEVNDYRSSEALRELRLIQSRCAELFPDAKVLFTGSLAQYTVMMDYVTWGQIKSFCLALGVIAILMILVFGSFTIGLIGMIPNVAPALVVAGIMGFAGIPLDIMTVTIMPMLLGLAVDDTIHFINHSQLEYQRTRDYREGTRRVFVAVGSAMFLTSFILTLTFSAYLFSVAKVFIHMGFLVGAGIAAALVADYFVTPVLLVLFKPFGKEAVETREKRRMAIESPVKVTGR